MENKIRPSPTGTYDIDLSRKRKSSVLKQAEVITDTFPDYNVSRDSKLQKVSSISGIDLRENTHGLGFNQRNSPAPIFFRRQIEKDQFSYQSDFADTRQTGNGNVSLGFPPQPSHYRPTIPYIGTPVGEAGTYLNRLPQACNLFGKTEAYNSLPSGQSYRDNLEKAKIDPFLRDSLILEMKNLVDTGKMRNQLASTPSESRSVEISQQSSQQLDRISDDVGATACFREANKFRFSCEFIQSGQYSKTAEIDDVQTVGTSFLRASHCTEQNENNKLLKNDVPYESSYLGASLGETSENKKHGNVGGNIKTNEQTKKLDAENSKNNLMEESSLKNGGSPSNIMEGGQIRFPSDGSLKIDEKRKLLSAKQASVVAEILWDGSIQLNSSVTLSAVAYFKSGEKLHDINWSEFVEVKGKVKLEAFEKYIQDLPRSRNRGLMVISLCWKEGSSESGLTGMKEIAKAYKKWERVGFAQPAQGIDLYICPRCDKIITILAKYGFLKGMTAVVDNQDSFIGCVVWRKNQTSLSTSARKSESKNVDQPPPLNSPSDSLTKVADGKMSPIHLGQESVAPVVVSVTTTSSATESTELERFMHSNSASQQFFHDQLSNFEAPLAFCSDPKQQQPITNLVVEKPVIPMPMASPVPVPVPVPSEIILKQHVPTFTDDDLPEFDFGIASGVSTGMNQPVITFGNNNRVPSEGIRKLNGSSALPKTMPIVQTSSSVSNGSNHSIVPRVPSYTTRQRLPNMEERRGSTAQQVNGTTSSKPVKNMFDDDDDDMPEWCPPEAEDNNHHTSGGTSGGVRANFPCERPKSTFQMIPPPSSSRPGFASHQSQILRTHHIMPFASQPSPPLPFHRPAANGIAKMPMPGTSGRGPAMEFNPNLSMRPRSSFDVKPPFPAVDKRRGWRPS